MKTVSVRDLRAKSAKIWRDLSIERDMVVTSNGKPVGILSAADEETLEDTIKAVRRARASLAVLSAQLASVKEGRNQLSSEEIEREIAAVRKKRAA
jgi:hypothetical protein